ncbi:MULTISPECIES: Mov34/MPN/PAD-1 family protein [Brevibacillus]|uniref:Mov34/MPN/PAD-1 family protein n=1 Tax=Brevibacillus TaxID=55080 RepID=UPI000B9C18C1|nr:MULTISPECIES: Mov34/MPN/PAD-1 family protein [Brevibacillus]MBG9789025.1 hypothetical protein [Brevibacillus laterosporus]MED1786454.1 Mov34/MPN/PAD-1 family protein [Brevibacillus laterosporus]RFB38675.1 hypothetical protein DZB91_02455 [Brevibacillus sp. VP]
MSTLYLTETAWSQIQRAVGEYPDLETGGVLLGYQQDATSWIITFASEPGPNALRMEHSILFDDPYLRRIIRRKTRPNSKIQYIGDWHSHTMPRLTPSRTDKNTFVQKSNKNEYRSNSPIMLIVGLNRQEQLMARAYFLDRGIRSFSKIEVQTSQAAR